MKQKIDFILDYLSYLGVRIIKRDELKFLLKKASHGYRFRIKIGITPTDHRLHLGHGLLLCVAKRLQEIGGIVVIVVADFSASLRGAKIKKDQIEQLWRPQIEKIMGNSSLEIFFQSDWGRRIKLADILSSISQYEASQLKEIPSFSRSIYFLTAAHDSLVVSSDVEIVGEDQKNFVFLSRALQRCYHKDPEVGLVIPNLLGLDGRKMSKSQNNCIYLSDPLEEVRTKIHSLPSEAMAGYFKGLTDYHGRIDPRTTSSKNRIREVLFKEMEKSIFRC